MTGIISADRVRKLLLLPLIWGVAIVFLAPVLAQDQGLKPKSEKTAGRAANEFSGATLYHAHCASCHGQDGKGNGPAAAALKTPPVDLTQLARNNGGKFPSDRVFAILNNQTPYPSHGSKEMPMWGPIFSEARMEPGKGLLRVQNVTAYLKSIQAK
jgi:mono/diheme cytochrome c family protein